MLTQPPPARRPNIADNDRLLDAEQQCDAAIQAMESLLKSTAMARQVVGLRDDRLKKEKAVLVAAGIAEGNSAAAAEWNALADPRYTESVKKVLRETAEAQEIVLRYELEKLKYDNAQALRNDERARMKIL